MPSTQSIIEFSFFMWKRFRHLSLRMTLSPLFTCRLQPTFFTTLSNNSGLITSSKTAFSSTASLISVFDSDNSPWRVTFYHMITSFPHLASSNLLYLINIETVKARTTTHAAASPKFCNDKLSENTKKTKKNEKKTKTKKDPLS